MTLLRLLAACALLSLGACSGADLLNATVERQGVEVNHDAFYAPGPRHGIDVYRADSSAGARPVVVFLYGGAWQSGSRGDYLFAATALARAGYVVFVPDYRLYPEAGYPAFLQDSAQAVAYARRVAPSWGGDPARVFVVAHSAGAYDAEMLALDPEWLAPFGMRPQDLAGVVSLAGPADFLPITGKDIQAVFGAHRDDPATQPINHVDGRNPPLLLLHGDADDTVELRNSTALAARIRAAGGPVELHVYPGVGHIGLVLGFSERFRGRSPVLADTVRFIAAQPPVPPATN